MKRLALLSLILCAWFHLAPAHAQFNGCYGFCGTSSSSVIDGPGFNNRQGSGGGSSLACTYTPVTTGTQNVAYTGATPSASGGVPAYTFSETGSLPTGLSINTSTGVISGTPSVNGSFPGIQVQVADTLPTTVNCGASFTLVIAAPAFVGLGDVKAGWQLAWGTRAFSSATRGNKLLNICNSTGGVDVLCADAFSDATTGQLVIPVSLASFCPGANCTIKTYYELTGNANCSSTPCDLTATSTLANRPILTANAVGTATCGVSPGSSSFAVNPLTANALSQPFSVSAVVKLTSTAGEHMYFGSPSGGGIGTGLISSDFAFFGSSNVLGPAADTNAHAVQSILATTSSFVVVDTTVGSTGSSGGQALGGNLTLYTDPFAEHWPGALCELAVYPAAFNATDYGNINSNQHNATSGYNF